MKRARDLYYLEHLRTLASRHLNLRAGFRSYDAGPPVMVETCMDVLLRRGLRAEDFHANAS